MTAENRTTNIAEELGRSDTALASARLLLNEGFLNDAVSRIYYYVLYHVRALLLTRGLEARIHECALRLYSLHFIKQGPLPASAWFDDATRLCSELRSLIAAAGYSASIPSGDDARR